MSYLSLRGLRARVRIELERAFAEEHTPHEVASSFAIGIFVTSLPSGGLGLVLFAVLTRLYAWVSTVAIFSTAFVLNPVVKPLFYLASYWIGAFFVTSDPVTWSSVTLLDTILDVVVRTLVGVVLLGVVLSAVSYVVVYKLTVEYRRRNDPGEWVPLDVE